MPYAGVNGLRWINLSRELALLGWEVRVIVGRRRNKNKVDLTQGGTVKVIEVSKGLYASIVEWAPRRFHEKLIKYFIVRLMGFIFWDDYAQYWRASLERPIKQFCQANPSGVVICTGGPFQACLHTKRILDSFNNKYVVDFQDPWAGDALSSLSQAKEAARAKFQDEVIKRSDLAIFVTEGLRKRVVESGSRILENGHDFFGPSIQNSKAHRFKGNRLKLLYLGTLANGRDVIFIKWLKMARIEPFMVDIDIYGRISAVLLAELKTLGLKRVRVRARQPVDRSQLLLLSSEYDVGLQLNSEEYPYLVSTKVYEYPALGLPVLSINGGGEIESLINGNGIGVSINILKPNCDFSKTVAELKGISVSSLNEFSQNSSWRSRAKQLSDMLEAHFVRGD